MDTSIETLQKVAAYYGQKLQRNSDLKTNACCPVDSLPRQHRKILEMIDEEIITRFYGCGSPLPPDLSGRTVLDLGCGTGRDAYIASNLVGPEGRVIGVDMTPEQLAVAQKHVESQMRKFGLERPNIEFKHGFIEDLQALGIDNDSIDVVISNCVINLSPRKERVFSEIFRVLKPGGELYFSDVFADRRVPANLQDDPVLYAECLSGTLYLEDFRRMLLSLGIRDYRVVSKAKIEIDNEEIEKKIGGITFHSITIRAFKLDSLEDRCEDYGQVATYMGTLPEFPHAFVLDDHHLFPANKPVLVCGNTASMLQETRYARHFRILGDRSRHFGLFDCSTHALPQNDSVIAACGC